MLQRQAQIEFEDRRIARIRSRTRIQRLHEQFTDGAWTEASLLFEAERERGSEDRMTLPVITLNVRANCLSK